MKKNLLYLVVLLTSFLPATAQVTRLSNNTSYEGGLPLTNNLIILRSKLTSTLWVYDVSGNTFTQLSSTVTVDSISHSGVMNNVLYFAGKTTAEGIELWKTDGTPGGTAMVKDINATGAANSDPKRGFVVYNNEIYFTADDGTNGRELWKSNGTTAGTVLVKDINTGAAGAFPDSISYDFKIINGVLVFPALRSTDGDELWVTDGTGPGTTQLKDIYTTPPFGSRISNFTQFGTDLYFSAFDPVNGQALWKTNGTAGGTGMVKDIDVVTPVFPPPFYFAGVTIIPYFLNFQGNLYFAASDGINGFELWKTDGTTLGTVLIKDINPGSDDGFPQVFLSAQYSGKFFFGATTANEGTELWQSDGTGPGTTLFADIAAGPTSSDVIVVPDFTGNGLLNGTQFFFGATTPGVEGTELYVSDGTPGGTGLLKDINPGPPSGGDFNTPWIYTPGKFFFIADDGINGPELWQTDGTSLGTSLVQDINPTPGAGSDIPFFIVSSGALFFFGTDGDDAVNTDFFRLDAPLALPLRWVSFMAKPVNNDIRLLWETGDEDQTDHFVVQRSTDGKNYIDLTQVTANGVGSHKYECTDAGAMKKSGVKKWYYRIKYVDRDGKSALSRVATVALNKLIASMLVMPNPVANELKISIQATGNDPAILQVKNIEGKTVLQRSIAIHRGDNMIVADVTALPNGVYILQIATGESGSTERFLIQR